MIYRDLRFPIIRNFEKSKIIKTNNNILSDELKEIRKYYKIQKHAINDAPRSKKLIEDSGFYFMDNNYFRNTILAKAVDSIGESVKYLQRKISSRYNNLGKLESRYIEKSNHFKDGNEFYYSMQKSIEVDYPQNAPGIITLKSIVAGNNTEKIIQKGKPTLVRTIEKKFDTLNGGYKIVTERKNYAHLNKSPLRFTESIYNENDTTETKKILKKAVQLKNGTKLQTGEHNGAGLLVEIPPKGQGNVIIHKTNEAIEEVLSRYGDEVKNYLL